jgi:hypothetical protein
MTCGRKAGHVGTGLGDDVGGRVDARDGESGRETSEGLSSPRSAGDVIDRCGVLVDQVR